MKKQGISSTTIILAVVCIAVACILPFLFKGNYYTQLFSQTLINLIAALGLNVVMGMAGQSNLGTIGLVAIGAYVTSLIATHTGSTTLLGLLGVIIAGVIIGLMLGYPSLRVNGIFLSLTTMSFAQIVYSLSNNLTWLTGGAMGVKGYPLPNILGFQVTNQIQLYFIILVVTLLLIVFSARFASSKYGRAMKAVRDNPEAVESLGLSVTKLKLMAFLIATTLGCLAGMFYAWVMQYVSPTTFTTDIGTRYVVILMLGGIGSTAGMVLGSILVTLLPEILRFMGQYYQLVFYTFALVLILFYPQGLSALFTNLKNKLFGKKQDAAAKGE